ncbi:MAG: diadenylate cyclase CdaA [Stomatobaculum sp.]|nr:diadenylate cyclase CdaA [Stomatobaculum sp.]
MELIMENLQSLAGLLPRITLTGFIEIAIISLMVYAFLNWVMDTEAWVLLRGLFMIFAFVVFCAFLQLDTILWILGRIATIAVIALVIIFQPELRRALQQLGSSGFFAMSGLLEGWKASVGFSEETVMHLVDASFKMGKVKTGALMVIEQKISLKDFIAKGIEIDGIVSSQLLINIFEHNTPLHDGAVIIRGNRIVTATSYLPLSEKKISKEYGTRHRAALGISEVSDSVTIVVSEETGRVSVARDGRLMTIRDPEKLQEILTGLIKKEEPEPKRFGLGFLLKGKDEDERKDKKQPSE